MAKTKEKEKNQIVYNNLKIIYKDLINELKGKLTNKN